MRIPNRISGFCGQGGAALEGVHAVMAVTITLSKDNSTATVSLPTVELTAEQIDFLIADIAAARGRMIPEVSQTFPHGKPTHRHDGTKYFFGIDPFAKLLLLSFRSPLFGWLTFGIPEREFERMYRQLRESKGRVVMAQNDKSH